MEYRRRSRSAPRFTLVPIFLMLLLTALVVAVLFVGFRMLLAGRPQITLQAPFDLVGRNAPLLLEIKDPRYGLRSARVAVKQGNNEQVILDETYDPPRREVPVRWSPAQDRRFRLQEG